MKNSENRSQSAFWFRQKTYGYGVTPCSIEGWLVTLLLAVLLVGGSYVLFGFSPEPTFAHVLYFFIYVALVVIIFFRLMKSKTKGELGWRWGRKDQER